MHEFLLPPCGDRADLQGSRLTRRLPPAGLFDELTEQLVLQLWVGQTHLQGTLGQGDMVIDGRSIDGHVDEQLTGLINDEEREREREKMRWINVYVCEREATGVCM